MTTSSNPPSFIAYKNWNFLITDCPSQKALKGFVKLLKSKNVRHVVRACDPSYKTQKLTEANIEVHDLSFPDGGFPPPDIIHQWLALCHQAFLVNVDTNTEDHVSIGVHCVAGLGRAPVLVALALMDRGMTWREAVEEIRKNRPGAINAHQLQQLRRWTRSSRCSLM